ncbi:hypothetical protein [Streptomyces sp. Je 1-332]|uniref:hypothetical protein n=1 Tax=Streptomyces sp. Je 1-332 TaxID=3231270 RepID=UPI003459BED5
MYRHAEVLLGRERPRDHSKRVVFMGQAARPGLITEPTPATIKASRRVGTLLR